MTIVDQVEKRRAILLLIVLIAIGGIVMYGQKVTILKKDSVPLPIDANKR